MHWLFGTSMFLIVQGSIEEVNISEPIFFADFRLEPIRFTISKN